MSHVQIVPLCPSKVPMRRPSSDRHRLADRSFAQLMRRSPSRLNLRQGEQRLRPMKHCRASSLRWPPLRLMQGPGGRGYQPWCVAKLAMHMHGVLHALDLCQWPLMAFEQVWPHRGGGV